MPAPDLDLLIDAAHGAAELAMRFFRDENRVWQKGDDSPVSQADLAVDGHLRQALCAARPDYGWLSEETPDVPARLEARRVFIVDPIDGTRAFLDGQKVWGHSIAVAEDGVVTAAVVYLPAAERLYAAAAGQGATLNGAPIQAASTGTLDGARILGSRRHLLDALPDDLAERIDIDFRPSMAYRLCRVAEGKADGAATLAATWEWDIAAGCLIAAEAGARVTDRTGAPIRFNAARPQADGMVVAVPDLHAAFLDAL